MPENCSLSLPAGEREEAAEAIAYLWDGTHHLVDCSSYDISFYVVKLCLKLQIYSMIKSIVSKYLCPF